MYLYEVYLTWSKLKNEDIWIFEMTDADSAVKSCHQIFKSIKSRMAQLRVDRFGWSIQAYEAFKLTINTFFSKKQLFHHDSVFQFTMLIYAIVFSYLPFNYSNLKLMQMLSWSCWFMHLHCETVIKFEFKFVSKTHTSTLQDTTLMTI